MHDLMRRGSLASAGAALLLVLGGAGCNPQAKKADPATTAKGAVKAATVGAKAGPTSKPVATVPKAPPRPTKLMPPPPIRSEYAGAHILVSYKGASRAKPTLKRTKEQALAEAKKLLKQAAAHPEKFAELAKKRSDGPSAVKGGDLGVWTAGRMVKAFDDAISKMKVGEVSKEPVETPFGFHILKRNPLPEQISGVHILIAFKGARRAKPSVTRSKEEAKKLAEQTAKEVAADPKKFDEICPKLSDGPNAKRGGFIGTWRKGRGMPAFEKALEPLAVGKSSAAVETPFGFHIFRRAPIPPVHAGSHILISYKGASRARPWIVRSKDEAKQLATVLCTEVTKDPKAFEQKALENSDGPTARYGGNLGQWRRGQMVPAFDETIAKLKDGQINPEPVESPFGFHVIRRNPVIAVD